MQDHTIVYYESFTERDAHDMPYRGYASHIYVEFGDGRRCPVYFIDLARLGQELCQRYRSTGEYFSNSDADSGAKRQKAFKE